MMRILLAEDDENISIIAKMALEQLGRHSVDVASDGAMALEKALAHPYDVLLLDEMMPQMNGLSVCRAYKQHAGQAPVIFLSAKSQTSDIDQFKAEGAGHIQKPFDPIQLSRQLAEILQNFKNEPNT